MPLQNVTDARARVYADAVAILREAIAPDAQLPEQRFQDLLAGCSYRLFAYSEGEDVRGVALGYFSLELRFAWLDYFAIRADLRGRGLGSKLFREIAEIAGKQDPKPDWLLFEVDDDYQGAPEREAECKRRVQFYRRLGAQVLENVPYKFPSAFAEPIRMRLMAYQLHPNAQLAADNLRQAVQEIFQSIHGRGRDDALLRWFEQSLPQVIELK
ncbi:MAG TPA: GNAT family N-acetyltransferase [Terriglobales bacterium]|nr:GNAT family N-acetyltransferase [Terriglobales bacterium]